MIAPSLSCEQSKLVAFAESIPGQLFPLECKPRVIEDELATRTTAGNRIELSAKSWDVLHQQQRVAECRVVNIQGTSLEILNVMIFPENPDTLPIFVIETLITGGMPRLAFVDLQSARMSEENASQVKSQTAALKCRYQGLANAKQPPEWAIRYSLGEYIFASPEGINNKNTLETLFCDALRTWVQVVLDSDQANLSSLSLSEMQRFKEDHVRESPVAPYLGKLFGPQWAEAFLNQFLYR